jgi:hypothetical protein
MAQSSVCQGQFTTLAEVIDAFGKGSLPAPSELSGSWVAIGLFGAAFNHGREIALIDCEGLKECGNTLEEVLLADGYTVTPYVFGTPETGRPEEAKPVLGALSFPIDFGGDASPVYRCRLTNRGTLICLTGVYGEGREFKRTPVSLRQVCQPIPNDGYCGPAQ